MNVILEDGKNLVVSFEPGEDIMAGMRKLCDERDVTAGMWSGIGAVREVELAWYDVDEKEYSIKTFKEKLEIASLLGNVGRLEGEVAVHAHGVFSGKDMQAFGGHVNRAIVGAACEVCLNVLPGTIKREYSEELGLNLMKPR